MSRKCPFCAEKIKDAAIKCKHCGSDLSSHSKNGTDANTFASNKKNSTKDVGTDVETIIARYKKHRKWIVGLVLIMIIAFFIGAVPGLIIIAVLIGEIIAMKRNKDKIDQVVQSMIQEGKEAEEIISMLVTWGLSRRKSEEIVEYQGIITGK